MTRFQHALPRSAISQLATTLVRLIALIALMHGGLAAGWPAVLALGTLAAGLTVRAFIIQHDCGHGSFLPGRLANDMLGRFCSLLTLTPFAQ
ncbi:MAG TPA: fatty acid desaturase [Candidatus Limnocylindria bacterium]|nr:fatty acid desaturase [Candidatus Limnocylindria bacterium]